MRFPAALLLFVLAAGCNDRRTFDEHYRDTERNLQNRADNLDRQLGNDTENSSDAKP